MSSFLSVRPRRTGACSVRGPLNRIPEPAARRKAQKLEAQGFPAARSADRRRLPRRRAITGRRGTTIPPPPGAAKKQTWNGPSLSAHGRHRIPGSRQIAPQTDAGQPPLPRRGQPSGSTESAEATAGDPCRKTTPRRAACWRARWAALAPRTSAPADAKRPAVSRTAHRRSRNSSVPAGPPAADINGPQTDAEHPPWTGRRRQAKSRRSRRSGGS